MTFTSDEVRMLFHQLPTEVQVNYADFEAKLAVRKQSIHVEGILRHENALEVVIRITENFKCDVPARAG